MKDSTTRVDVLVIGGGPAGITFCRTLKKLRPEMEIAMLRPEKKSMVYCAIPYALEGVFEPARAMKKDSLVTESGTRLVRRAARSVDLRARRAVDDAGEAYEAEVLFLATGAVNAVPPVPGADATNIHTVKTQEDMEGLLEALDGGAGRAVVVGAGAIGIEQAQAYRARGLAVDLVDAAPRVLPSMVDEDMAEGLHENLRGLGIGLRLSARLEGLEKEGDRASAVLLSGCGRIDLDAERDFVCFAVGMRPDVALFEGQGLEMGDDGIVVDARMRTGLPGVYAAGDCCSFPSGIDGKPVPGKLATNAVPMAKTAARVVAGRDEEYPGFFNGAATCVGDSLVASTGFTAEAARERGMATLSGYGETTTLFPMMPNPGKVRVKIVAETGSLRIVGGQVVNALPATDKIDLITLAMQRRLTLRGLSKLSYSAQPWQSFMPARSAVVQACEDALERAAAESGALEVPEAV